MCTKPIRLRVELTVPCGKCFECRLNKANDWATRIMMESTTTGPCFFVTLTYNEDTLPRDYQGRPTFAYESHVKPLFRELARVGKFRYFCIGEHGTDTERPHYHFISFGVSHDNLGLQLDKWWLRYGFYQLDPLLPARILYVSLFHVLVDSEKYPDEFSRMSRRPGIGCDYLSTIDRKSLEKHGQGYVTVLGEKRKIPRYCLDKYGFDDYYRETVRNYRWTHIERKISRLLGYTISRHDLDSLDDDSRLRLALSRYEEECDQIATFKRRHRKSRHIKSTPQAINPKGVDWESLRNKFEV